MSEGKEIKFKFVVDEQSAQRVNRVLDEMIKRAQTLAQTLSSVGGGGGGGAGIFGGGAVGGKAPSAQSTMARASGTTTQKTSFANVLTQNVDTFKKLAAEGGSAMKVLGDAVQRGITGQQREINKLQQSLDALVRTYDRVGGAASGALGEKIQDKAIALQARIAAGKRDLNKMEAMAPKRGDLMPEIPWPGEEGAKRGLGGRMKDWATQKGLYSEAGGGGLIQGFAPKGIGGMLRMGGMVLAGADAAFTEARSGTRAYNQAEAARGQMMNPRIRALKGGDVSDIMALQMMDKQSKDDLKKQAIGTGADAEAIVTGLKSAVSRTVGSLTSGVLGQKGGNILGGLTDAEKEGMKAENMFQYVDNFKKSGQYLKRQMAMEQFEGGLESRIGSARVMGYGIRQKRRPDGTMGPYQDTYSEREAGLRERGYSLQEEQAAFLGVRSVAGTQAAFRHKGAAMAAQSAGYGGYGELLGVSERMGMGGIMAQAAVGGGIDKTAGIGLGQALLGTGFDVQGMTSRAGVMAAMQTGMGFRGNAQDFPLVQQGLAGLQLGTDISTGATSPQQRGQNLLAAIKAAPGGSSYLQDYMGNQMSMEKMIDVASGADQDKTLEALGGDQSMVKKVLGGKMSSSLNMLYGKGLKGTKLGGAMDRWKESGLDIDEYLQKARKGEIGEAGDVETLGIGFAQATGKGQEAGIGLSKTLSGIGGELKTGGVGGGKQDELVTARLKVDANRIKEAGQELANNVKEIAGAFGASGDLARSYESFNQNLSASAEILTESFMRVADAANKAALKLDPSGGAGGQSRSPASGKAGAQGKTK
jgi:hypothetical protein